MEEESEEQRRSEVDEAVEEMMWNENRGRGNAKVVSRGLSLIHI